MAMRPRGGQEAKGHLPLVLTTPRARKQNVAPLAKAVPSHSDGQGSGQGCVAARETALPAHSGNTKSRLERRKTRQQLLDLSLLLLELV